MEYSDDESSDGCAHESTAACAFRPSELPGLGPGPLGGRPAEDEDCRADGGILGIVVVAYNYSLTTLLQLADLNTPLAYVSLVPLISLMLAFMYARTAEANRRSTIARPITSSAFP